MLNTLTEQQREIVALAREFAANEIAPHAARWDREACFDRGVAEKLGEDGLLDPEAIAECYWQIHRQPRSTWSHEVDLRPYKETF